VPDFLSAPSLSSILGFAAGVGYCALVRAPLIEHNFDFTQDYKFANPKFRDQRNGVQCLVLTISITKSEESKVAGSRRPPDLGVVLA